MRQSDKTTMQPDKTTSKTNKQKHSQGDKTARKQSHLRTATEDSETIAYEATRQDSETPRQDGKKTRPKGEHPVSAKCWGLRNRLVRWWVPGFTPGNPIFASLFEKNVFFPGLNRVLAAFQPHFSHVSAT